MKQANQILRTAPRIRFVLTTALAFAAGTVVAALAKDRGVPVLEGAANAVPRSVTERADLPQGHDAPSGRPTTQFGVGGEPRLESTPDMAADRRRHKAAHDQLIANHRAEPMREPWASRTAATLRSDLEQIAERGKFRVIEVECRDATCLSTLEWSNYGVALQEWPNILHHAYGVPCGTRVSLDEPTEQSVAYRSTVITLCTKAIEGTSR